MKLSVLNLPRKNVPFVSRNTAFSCHGSITFLDLSRKTFFDMPIRWSNNPQPVRPDIDEGKFVTVVEESLMRAGKYIDIPADEREELDVGYRDPIEKVVVGWNNDSYRAPGGRFPVRVLPTGDFIIHVTIKHNDGSIQSEFLLHNPEDVGDFKLELFGGQ